MTTSQLARLFCASAASIALLTACTKDAAPVPVDTASLDDGAQKAGAVKTTTPGTPAGQLPEGVTPTAYRLHLVTRPAETHFSGNVEIDVDLDSVQSRIWFHALEQTINQVSAHLADGTVVPATFTGEEAPGGVSRLDFESPLPAGRMTLKIDYKAPYNLALAGLYKATQADRPYLATQMEPIDARRMVPSFDEPRFKTPWTITVDAPTDLRVIANGADLAQEPVEDGLTRHTFATTRPIQSYLVALAVGPYEMRVASSIPANDLRKEPIPLRGFAAQGKGDKLNKALAKTDSIVLWQEDYFDYPYPYGKLDLIAAPEFAYGAMENAGAIIYREAALLIDDRTSLNRERRIMTTHAHELGHQWFGNLVTPKWWNDIWLNEAFATWISYKSMDAVDPNGGWKLAPISAGLGAMSSDSLKNARQIRNPITRNGDIMDGFDSITYRKGGSVLNMFENYLGEEAFRDGIRLHMKRFEDGVADADDFMKSLADGSGQDDVVPAFESFILQPGIPLLNVSLSCPTGTSGLLSVTQSRYAPIGSEIDQDASQWMIPFAATIHGATGIRPVRKMLTDKTTEIEIKGDCPDWIMPNADGAGYWRFNLDEAGTRKLAENFRTLTESEQLVAMDYLTSSFAAGNLDAVDLLEALELTASGAPDAVMNGLNILSQFSELLSDDDRPLLSAWVQDTYGPVLSYLKAQPNDSLSASQTLLKNRMSGALLRHGQDDMARTLMLINAKLHFGYEMEPVPGALASNDMGIATTIGAQDGGQGFYDAALAYVLQSDNQNERSQILSALSRHSDAPQASALLTRALSDEFSSDELYRVWSSALGNDANLPTLWPQFKGEFDAIVAKIPEIRKPQISGFTGAFCDAESGAEAAAFFASKADIINGYERSLAQGVERANLCGALKTAQAAKLKAALEAK